MTKSLDNFINKLLKEKKINRGEAARLKILIKKSEKSLIKSVLNLVD